MKKIFFIIIFLTCVTNISYAQKTTLTSPVSIEDIIPPSPESQALSKYGNLPIGLFTGTPNVSIELINIKAKKVNLPISINYSSNGIKVDEVPARIGMSWVLNAGGVITRTIYDKPDDKYARATVPPSENFNFSISKPEQNLVSWIENIFVNKQDTQFDEYSFNFNGYNGKFIIDLNNNIVQLPYSNLKIESNPNSTVWNFKITTPDGLVYYFGGSATESILTGSGSCSRNDTRGAINSWYLTRIENTNDLADYITISYNQTSYAYTSHITHTITNWDPSNICGGSINPVTGVDNNCGCNSPCIFGTPNSSLTLGADQFCITQNIFSGVYPDEIVSSIYGKAKFSYIPKYGFNTGTDYLLKNIAIFQNKDGTNLLKTFIFNYTMANTLPGLPNVFYQNDQVMASYLSAARPFLNRMDETDNNLTVVKSHLFEYNDLNSLPPRLSFAQDYWGYYNGTTNYSSFIPMPSQYSTLLPANRFVDRNPNYAFASKGILLKVIFPTGGSTQLIWEGNSDVQSPTSAASGGGMRVKQRINFDPVSGQSTTTNYQYSGTIIPYAPNYYNRIVSKKYQYSNWAASGADKCVFDATSSLVSASYIQFSSNTTHSLFGRGSSPVYYTSVTESTGNNFIVGGIEHTYTYFFDPPFNQLKGNVVPNVSGPSLNWKNGLETSQNIFKMVNGSKVYLKKIVNSYNDDTRVNNTYKQYAIKNNGSDPLNDPVGIGNYANMSFFNRMDFFDVMSYPLTQKWTYLSSKQETTYDQNGQNPLTTTTNYYYDNTANTQPTRVEVTDSKGNTVRTINRTALEKADINNAEALTNTASAAIDEMLNRNMVGQVIQQEQQKSGQLITRQTTNYKITNNMVLPDNIKVQKGSNVSEQRVQFNNYDTYGNVLEQQKSDDIKHSYIWSYASTYPVAEVTNSDYGSIAYTSFESDGKGNWDYADGAVVSNDGVTGNKAFNLNGNNINRTALNGSTTYTITYWLKNSSGNCSLGGTALMSKNGWTLYTKDITSTTTLTISGTGTIDELRLYPKGAMMTTYTYQPLIGMSSQCDMNNKISYYEYDSFGRLQLIRDMDKNILKTFDYKYKEVQ